MTCVYIISNGQGQVKIGRSADPKKRLGQLQTGSPFKLEILWSHNCRYQFIADAIEAMLHEHVRSYGLQGEWFDRAAINALPDEIKKAIDRRSSISIGQFDARTQCHVLDWGYQRVRLRGLLYMPKNECCDMRGCIETFQDIDPNVREIHTFAGGEASVRYARAHPNSSWRVIYQA